MSVTLPSCHTPPLTPCSQAYLPSPAPYPMPQDWDLVNAVNLGSFGYQYGHGNTTGYPLALTYAGAMTGESLLCSVYCMSLMQTNLIMILSITQVLLQYLMLSWCCQFGGFVGAIFLTTWRAAYRHWMSRWSSLKQDPTTLLADSMHCHACS